MGSSLRNNVFQLEGQNCVLSTLTPPTQSCEQLSCVSKNATRPFTQKIFAAWFRRRKTRDSYFDDIPGNEDLGIHFEGVRRFSLRELKVITENFSHKERYNKIYIGWLADGSPVVVKKFKDRGDRSAEVQFQTEVEINSIALHPNLLHMLGFCITPTERLIVYPLLPNGSVASCLRDRHKSQPSLIWSVRKGIALGVASGLAYLHEKCGLQVIHRDVRAANVLLDENFEAVVGAFELAVIMDCDVTHVDTPVSGTIGHVAPEYLASGICSVGTDVFGYGVFLLELITGQRAFDLARVANDEDMMILDWVKRNLNEGKWEKFVDPNCEVNNMEEVVKQLIKIALLCTQTAPQRRPKMSKIVRMLEVEDVLVERWKEWCNEQMMDLANSSLIFSNSESSITVDGLSGPSKMSRHNWERLVLALVKREQLWPLFHEQSRSPSISIISSDFSGQILDSPSSSLQPVSVSPHSQDATANASVSQGNKDLGIHFEGVRSFSLHELKVITENFSHKEGIYNYKGRLADGSPVVVKKFKDRGDRSAEVQFQTELEINSFALHPNLLHMLGFCITPTEQLIIYPSLPNGSVASCLRDRHESQHPMSWSARKGIALGAARGLAYLHEKCDPQVIHRDVKAANILLDENFEAVVGDFELAVIMDYDVTHANTPLFGTFGHNAPEYLCGICSVGTDVFGYGAFLLELVTGQRAFDLDRVANYEDLMLLDWVKRNLNLGKWEKFVDPDCEVNNMEEVAEQLTQIALLCTQTAPQRRPKMLEIVRMLEVEDGLAERWKEWCNEQMMDLVSSSLIFSNSESSITDGELSGPR